MNKLFTKGETEQRLRVAARLARRAEDMHPFAKVEVGLRVLPHAFLGRPPCAAEAHPAGDDHYDCVEITEAKRLDAIRQFGAVVHLWVYSNTELVGVATAWLGVPGQDPTLIDVDGKAMA